MSKASTKLCALIAIDLESCFAVGGIESQRIVAVLDYGKDELLVISLAEIGDINRDCPSYIFPFVGEKDCEQVERCVCQRG